MTCGLRTCDQTIRAVCYEEAGLLADWLHTAKAAGASFAAAAGDIEFQTDGTMVNTWEGWREMRLGIFAKRQRGRPAPAAQWDTRRLPAPHARVLFGGSRRPSTSARASAAGRAAWASGRGRT